jgi:hypothetical protein
LQILKKQVSLDVEATPRRQAKERLRHLAIHEMVQTERDYIADLEILHKVGESSSDAFLSETSCRIVVVCLIVFAVVTVRRYCWLFITVHHCPSLLLAVRHRSSLPVTLLLVVRRSTPHCSFALLFVTP